MCQLNLRLGENAIINESYDLNNYPITQVRWEGKLIPCHIGLIYAIDAENIGITGEGKIAGSYKTEDDPDKPMEGLILENISGTCQKGISLTYVKKVKLKNIYLR